MNLCCLLLLAAEVLYLRDSRVLDCDSYRQQGDKVLVHKDGGSFSLPAGAVDWAKTAAQKAERLAEQKRLEEERAIRLARQEARKAPIYSGLIIEKLDVKQARVEDLLRYLCNLAGLDLVVDPSVAGKKATYFLKNIRWEDALAMVINDANLEYRIVYGNLIVE